MLRASLIPFALALLGPLSIAWSQDSSDLPSFVNQHCSDCHSGENPAGKFSLEELLAAEFEEKAENWERVVRRLRTRQMPPADAERPSETEYAVILDELTTALDAIPPRPDRVGSLRRLTRTEYGNAIRDLLAVRIDVARLLPADDVSHGFDNVTVETLSPSLMERYLTVARKVSRQAMGSLPREPASETIRIPADETQEQRVPGLPFGTRGGALIPFRFPRAGSYRIEVRLTRDRNEHVEGLRGTHEMFILLDRRQIASFNVDPPQDRKDHHHVDEHLRATLDVPAGEHQLGVTFRRESSSLLETKRQPYQAHFNFHRHPRLSPAVFQVTISGPFELQADDSRSPRRTVFNDVVPPAPDATFEMWNRWASELFRPLMRRAYRRSINVDDLQGPLRFFHAEREVSGVEAGLEAALTAMLVSPNFLFKIERAPEGAVAGELFPLSNVELASRLSFFLWSSIPDEALLSAAEGDLRSPEHLATQVARMLRDSRVGSLSQNFAGQWLHLRNLDSVTPDSREFPDFDHNLRKALKRETELLFESVVREDRSVLDLLRADYTYLNERLARHYGIPHVMGSHFRKVENVRASRRGGLLRQGSILTVTSYATRTSPVIRGKWVLENILGTPPPPPPANVPALEENTIAGDLPLRQRLAEHRENPACFQCHMLMDPVGFSLENFDAVGRWRSSEEGRAIDVEGGLPDGSECQGVAELEAALLDRPELFATTFTEKLLTFALGRGLTHRDAPAVRRIVSAAAAEDFRFSAIALGIARSVPFQMRIAE